MMEILPIKSLTEEDTPFFGSLSVYLGILSRAGLPVGQAVAVTPPYLKLKTTLERYKLDSKEFMEQALTLVKKEIVSTPVPPTLILEAGRQKQFFIKGQLVKSVKDLWIVLLNVWLDQIKSRFWNSGFYPGLTAGLETQIVTFVKKLESFGEAYLDPLEGDVAVVTKSGKLKPEDLQKVIDLVKMANKKLFIPHQYGWLLDGCIKLTSVMPYTPLVSQNIPKATPQILPSQVKRSAVKVFLEASSGLTDPADFDGLYIASERILNLNKPEESFENLVLRLTESAGSFPQTPVLFKLADQSEGMGKIRGALRLIHQKSLFNSLAEVLNFARLKKGLNNIHITIPFVRSTHEFLQIKKGLAACKLIRKPSLQFWLELAVPENILNLKQYLSLGLDGAVINLDEMIAHLNGFDPLEEDLLFYKNELEGLVKFLGGAFQTLHQSKIPVITYGTLSFYPSMLEFLVEKGVYGIVAEKYEAHSAYDLFRQAEKRMILKRSASK